MTQDELFRFQKSLIVSLSDPPDGFRSSAPRAGLMGIRPEMLELLAELALGKRIEKIAKILRKTCSYLQQDLRDLGTEFASQHPSIRPDSFFNACQFYSFLRHRWLIQPPERPFLPDLAYCELAMIAVERKVRPGAQQKLLSSPSCGKFKIRRHPAVHTRRCQYNIRGLLAGEDANQGPVGAEPVCLVLSQPLNEATPKVFHIRGDLFALLRSWTGWSFHGAAELMEDDGVLELWRKLECLGFIEVMLCE